MRIAPVFFVLAMMCSVQPPGRRAGSYFIIANAIVDACDTVACTADLVAIGHHESRFVLGALGPGGEVGVWQLKPAHLKGVGRMDVPRHAKIVVRLVEQSRRVCGDLTLYTSGRCGWGRKDAREIEEIAAGLH